MSHNTIVWNDIRLIRQIYICNQLVDAVEHKARDTKKVCVFPELDQETTMVV